MIDFRDLLKKYMSMVLEGELTTFIDWGSDSLTEEEFAELELIERELSEDKK